MEQRIVKKRRPTKAGYDVLITRTGGSLGFGSDEAFRNLLDNIHPRCEVEAEGTNQYGEVIDIIRDRYGIPVVVKVRYEEENDDGEVEEGIDYIAMADITFWEPYDHCAPDENYYDYKETEKRLMSMGYKWDDERGCYYNAETGDEAVW